MNHSDNIEKQIITLLRNNNQINNLEELDKIVMDINVMIHSNPSSFLISSLKEEALKKKKSIINQQREKQFQKDKDSLLNRNSSLPLPPSSSSDSSSNNEECQLLEEDITASLMRLNRLMSKQVEKSERNLDTLKQGTKKLGETSSLYDSFEYGIRGSRQLIRSLWSSEMKDRRYIYFAMMLYLSVLLWIISKRIAPIRWALSLTIFTIKKSVNVPIYFLKKIPLKTEKKYPPFVVLENDKHLEELKIDFIKNHIDNDDYQEGVVVDVVNVVDDDDKNQDVDDVFDGNVNKGEKIDEKIDL